MGAIVEERIDWLTVKRIDMRDLVTDFSVPDEGVSVERADGFAAMSMHQPTRKRDMSARYLDSSCGPHACMASRIKLLMPKCETKMTSISSLPVKSSAQM